MLHSVGCAQVLTDAKFPRVVGTRFRPHSSLDPVAPSTQRELGSPFFRSRQSGCCPRRVWCGSSGARGTASRRLRSAAACRARRLRGASDVSRLGSRRVQWIARRAAAASASRFRWNARVLSVGSARHPRTSGDRELAPSGRSRPCRGGARRRGGAGRRARRWIRPRAAHGFRASIEID